MFKKTQSCPVSKQFSKIWQLSVQLLDSREGFDNKCRFIRAGSVGFHPLQSSVLRIQLVKREGSGY